MADDWTIKLVQDVAEIRTQLTRMNGTLVDVAAEIGGAPDYKFRADRPSLRIRMHDVEQTSQSVRLAAEGMLTEVRNLAETVTRLEDEREALRIRQKVINDQAAERRGVWTHWRMRLLFAFAFAAAVEGALRLAGIGG